MALSDKKDIYYDLEFIRGLAAILVVLGHARALYFVDYSDIISPSIFLKLFYFISGFGHQSVIVFFVLSGFLISKTVIKTDKFEWRYYLIARATRLWVVLVPALLFTVLFDYFGYSYFREDIYVGKLDNIFNMTFPGIYDIGSLIGNVFFLQTILTDTYGSNVPLWSLAYEFWYYILFPFCYFSYQRKRGNINVFCMSFLLLFIGYFNFKILAYFLLWLLGVGVFIALERCSNLKICRYISFSIFIFVLALNRFGILEGFWGDLLTGVGFSVLLFSILNGRKESTNKTYRIFSKFISNISYSLYLTHFPILTLISVSIFDSEKMQPNSIAFVGIFVSIFLVLLFSYFIYLSFERHHFKIRKLIIDMSDSIYSKRYG